MDGIIRRTFGFQSISLNLGLSLQNIYGLGLATFMQKWVGFQLPNYNFQPRIP